MYTAVLMVALTGSADVPNFGLLSCRGCFGISSCHGCWGNTKCHGSSGYRVYANCSGCNGWGGCFGSRLRGMFGCRGCSGCWGSTRVAIFGCRGGASCYRSRASHTTLTEKDAAPTKEELGKRAALTVTLPPEATLRINGQPTKSASAERVFVTEDLDPNLQFIYHMRAELNRDGRRMVVVKEVLIRAGEETRVKFDF